MLPLRNTAERYGIITLLFHWLMAFIIIGLLILGLYMQGLPISLQKLKLYGWHKQFGILLLGLAILRIGWLLISKLPKAVAAPYWQQLAARSVHLAFYGFMILMPLSGWLMSSASRLKVSFFGLFTLPLLIAPNVELRHFLVGVHNWLGYALIGAIGAHVGAALWHHFIHKDLTLRRMLP